MRPLMITTDYPELPADLLETLRFDLAGEGIKITDRDTPVVAETADSVTIRFETYNRPSLALEIVQEAKLDGRIGEWMSVSFGGHHLIKAEATEQHLLITVSR
jgi:hypothetical protein